MAEYMELLESIQTERTNAGTKLSEVDANPVDDGRSIAALRKGKGPQYYDRLVEVAQTLADTWKGRKSLVHLMEAWTTSDFPILFGDILERQMLARYETQQIEYESLVRIGTRNDFRLTALRELTGGTQPLEQVKETGEYPQRKYAEAQRTTYKLNKYGSAFTMSWETSIMEDFGFVQRVPEDMAVSARVTEEHFVTGMYVGPNGPNATLYNAPNANLITGEPPLSMASLSAAIEQFAGRIEPLTGRPILLRAATLVVPPALEMTARNLLNTTTIRLTGTAATALLGGAAGQEVEINSPLNQVLRLVVNPLIPFIANVSNGSTSWFLFASPTAGRAALELSFLRGRRAPEVFIKAADAVRVGGGGNPFDGSFDHDEINYKVRHVLGGGIIDPWLTMASNGTP